MVLEPDEQRRTRFAVLKLGDKAQELMANMDLAHRLPLTIGYQLKVHSLRCEAELAEIEF